MSQRSAYVFSLCREKALQGDVQMMMVREPAFHAEILMQGAFRALVQRHKGRVQIVRQPAPRPKGKKRPHGRR